MAKTDPRVRRLAAIRKRLDPLEELRTQLYDERLALFESLSADGFTQAAIGEAAGIGPSAVAFALHHARKQREKAASRDAAAVG